MQYILTEDEMKALSAKPRELHEQYREALQNLCTRVCDHEPVEGWHAKAVGEDKMPWGCILSKDHMGYCDLCPVSGPCPYQEKRWSK